MMGISSMELMVIAVVALILMGPKELPDALRTTARALRFLRRMAQEFRREVDVLMRDSEVDALRRDVEAIIRNADRTPPPTKARPGDKPVSEPPTPRPAEPVPSPPATTAQSDVSAKADGS
jgi:sec-independent protein translocase protein TatB